MTDQDLIKTVAGILGIKKYKEGYGELVCDPTGQYDYVIEFNPLANTPEAKAFCWDIAIKERMNLWTSNEHDLDVYNAASELASDYHIRDVYSMQRAVLLAFVELSKDK